MPPRYSASQVRSMIRQAEQKQRQATNKYNEAARRYNQGVKSAIGKYNQAVRAHNGRARANRQRLKSELARLARRPARITITQHVTYRASVNALHECYERLESRADSAQLDPKYNRILDLSERETANSLEVTNHLLGDESAGDMAAEELENAALRDGLRRISPDLDDRWNGAVYSLDLRNPDAARHFCTSAREIFTQILELKAPDEDVFASLPNCDRTDQGKPTRRSKIRYFLHRRGMTEETLEDFVERDMDNVVQLFHLFNQGTHGAAGTFDLSRLNAIKKRVEDGIMFLTTIVEDA